MGDKPANPADRLGKDAPKELRDFLSCTTTTVTLKDGKMAWTGAKLPPSLTIEPDEDDQSKGTLKVGYGGVGLSLPASVDANGQLSIDTSHIPDWTDELKAGKDAIDSFTKQTNDFFKANGFQLGTPIFIKGQVRLQKVPLVATQPQTTTPPVGTVGPAAGQKTATSTATAAPEDPAIHVGSAVIMPPKLPPSEVVAPPGSQPNPPFNPPPKPTLTEQAEQFFEEQRQRDRDKAKAAVAVPGGKKPMITEVSRAGMNAVVGVVLLALVAGIGGFVLMGNLGGGNNNGIGGNGGGASQPGTSAAASVPVSADSGAASQPAPGETTVTVTEVPTEAPTPEPTPGLDLSKIQWQMNFQAGSDQIDAHCRIMVRADVNFLALGSSGEEDQALIDAVVGKIAIVAISGPGLPQQVTVTLQQQGSNFVDVGDITKATAGAKYQETLVSAAGIPLNIKSQVFINPCAT